MKKNILVISVLLSVCLSAAIAGQPDPRFDGKWAGIEAIEGNFVVAQLGGGQTPGRITALLAIGDSGKTLGFVQGITPGRYNVSPKSDGNTLVYKLANMHPKGVRVFYGRTDGKLLLSADGNNLTETAYAIMPGWPHSINCTIHGTFRRQTKK